MVLTKFLLTAAALSAPLVAGHGYMGLPKTQFKGGDITAPAGTINSSQFKAPSGMSFTTDPESNTKAYTAWIKTSEYKSLKDLITKKGGVGECGNSVLGDPQPLPAQVEWTHGASEGFTASHQGPCEVWCDDKMAFHDDNCAKNFPQAPAKLAYDKSKCTGAKKLTTYWLALHSPEWQIYIGCAALSGASSGGASGGSSGGSAASPTPSSGSTPTVKPSTPSTPSAPSPAAPAPAPATGGSDDDCDENLPEPGDDDCDENLPEPGETGGEGEDCDQDLPEPDCDTDLPEPDCDDDLPEPAETGNDADISTSNIGFSDLDKRGGENMPGKVSPVQY